MQDVRAVFARDQIYVVDPEVGGNLLIPRRTLVAFPFNRPRRSAPQPVSGSGEGNAVGPSSAELASEITGGQGLAECLVVVVGDVEEVAGSNF